ncbi:MAG TPA: hypothetical protein DCG32_08175, partial [Sphaerochaeta sp.]|nr:hypothetical protein [Sphaerochaeta sp.]
MQEDSGGPFVAAVWGDFAYAMDMGDVSGHARGSSTPKDPNLLAFFALGYYFAFFGMISTDLAK